MARILNLNMILEGSCLEELWWNCWLVGKGGLAVRRVKHCGVEGYSGFFL